MKLTLRWKMIDGFWTNLFYGIKIEQIDSKIYYTVYDEDGDDLESFLNLNEAIEYSLYALG